MADPLTLAVVGSTIVTEGIKFLYSQAGELIKHWRERKDKAAEKGVTEPVTVVLPENVFEGQLQNPMIHYDELGEAANEIFRLRQGLSPYFDGLDEFDPANEEQLKAADALRSLIEAVYQQRFTLKGESRPVSGPIVEGKIEVGRVLGNAATVDIENMRSGSVKGEAKADVVEQGGNLTGVKIKNLG